MTTQGQDHPMSDHLAKMIAKGEARPGTGPRFLPLSIMVKPGDKTAADWVAEGRR